MAISSHDAERIHRLAQDAGIPDATVEAWTEEAGGYKFAITDHTGTLKARQADEVRARIRRHVRDQEQATAAEAAKAAGTVLPPPGTPMATPAQVEYILDLLAQRHRSGDGGGFIMNGPTDRAGIESLTRAKASLYITSLKGDY
ncbi:hypothetical protein [Streptomyces sp. SID8352]|uniref:hypothetical protein n=1 Tax=Streptomyces sp. SID8352 TaxID=2690338 RepID=UPI001369CF54|nr:hypothetical protein [Streptomyces sp. SID8352]MYU22864.1 hypothetical protein [Streptomyces sp. SID8352]